MILVDTGFWIALALPNDQYHKRSVELLQSINEPLITTWPVLTETCHLFMRKGCFTSVERLFHMLMEDACLTFSLSHEYTGRIEVFIKKYRDLPMDLADASLVIAAEELDSGKILSTDIRDFTTYRWKQRKPFENLLSS